MDQVGSHTRTPRRICVLSLALLTCLAGCSSNASKGDDPLPDVMPSDLGFDRGVDSSVDAEDSAKPDEGTDVSADAMTDVSSDGGSDGSDGASDVGSDGRTDVIAEVGDTASDVTDVLPLKPYRKSIDIDGINDFGPSEFISTTSAGYTAFFAWDTENFYVGYQGDDISTAASPETKWLFVYLDVGGLGAAKGQIYNTQQPLFPVGFRPSFYLRWRADDTITSLERLSAGVWSTVPGVTLEKKRTGKYVEFRIPLSAIGSPTRLLVTSLMVNEKTLLEGAYAGLYPGNFKDGYASGGIPITAFLDTDFTSPLTPSDSARRKP